MSINSEQLIAEKALQKISGTEWAHQTISEDGRISWRVPFLRWIGRAVKFLTLDRFECIRSLFPQKSDVVSASSIVKKQIEIYCPEKMAQAPKEKKDLLEKVAERFNALVDKTNPGKADLKINLDVDTFAKKTDAVSPTPVQTVPNEIVVGSDDLSSESGNESETESPVHKSPASSGSPSPVVGGASNSPARVEATSPKVDKVALTTLPAAAIGSPEQNPGAPVVASGEGSPGAGAAGSSPIGSPAGQGQVTHHNTHHSTKNKVTYVINVSGNPTKQKLTAIEKLLKESQDFLHGPGEQPKSYGRTTIRHGTKEANTTATRSVRNLGIQVVRNQLPAPVVESEAEASSSDDEEYVPVTDMLLKKASQKAAEQNASQEGVPAKAASPVQKPAEAVEEKEVAAKRTSPRKKASPISAKAADAPRPRRVKSDEERDPDFVLPATRRRSARIQAKG